MSATHARTLALEVVSRVRARDAYAHETLDAVLRKSHAVHRDAAFATRLAYGTIACRGTLDEAVSRFVAKTASLEPTVADALALSAYELLFARTPPHVAVSEGVELVRSVQPRAAGFANAVLRRLADATPGFPWGDPATDDEALARSVGHPLWLTRMWVEELGRDVASGVMHANNEPAPLFLAHLPFTASFEETFASLVRDGVDPAPLHCPDASWPVCHRRLSGAVPCGSITLWSWTREHSWRHGPCVRSMRDHIVEIGSGRGSKTFIMAGLALAAGHDTRITAIDNHDFKLTALDDTARSIGLGTVSALRVDATSTGLETLVGPPAVDRVLVDAPCSGLGTLAQASGPSLARKALGDRRSRRTGQPPVWSPPRRLWLRRVSWCTPPVLSLAGRMPRSSPLSWLRPRAGGS